LVPHPTAHGDLERDLEDGVTDRFANQSFPLHWRCLCLGAATAASGRRDLVRASIRIALAKTTPVTELYETLLQTYLFAGYPRAINALAELTAAIPRPTTPRDIDLEPAGRETEWIHRGQDLCRKIYGSRYPKLLEIMSEISPDLGRWMVIEGYGKVLSRPGLSPTLRELTAVSALIPLSVPDQLRAHMRGALLIGASSEDLQGVIETAVLVAPDARESATGTLARVEKELAG
jgi:alkylhydroperoxidase/carboxymuconolactone decarboxylase family protein YurZ